ncbi:hypothetical protein PENSPDRAFT_629562 [Peniophora sp. CONT]|nr:hypothetical protein PENSPDRAFT_629562 [Peniophora sp. CONT]
MQTDTLYAPVDDPWISANWPNTASNGGYESFNDGDPIYQRVWYGPPGVAPDFGLQDQWFSYSAAFNGDFVDPDGNTPDFDLVANDGVYFAVTASKLRSSSRNNFGGLLVSSNSSAVIPLSSNVLNLVLHGVYGLSPAKFAPSVDDLAAAVDALEPYGLPKQDLVAHDAPLFRAILMRAPANPIACFTLAARAELEELAVVVSPYTLNVALSEVTNEDAIRIGPRYLKRLFFLHLGRVDALKRILLPPPDLHLPTGACKAEDQRRVSRAWTMAVAEMSWDLSPNISVMSLEARMRALGRGWECTQCLNGLDTRIRRLLVDWSLIKTTI